MKILVTGVAGFIGFHVAKRLLKNKHQVIGLDNINDYYDVNLKYARLNQLGIENSEAEKFNKLINSTKKNYNFQFIRLDINDRANLEKLFKLEKFDKICHLAAQAGVRYSITNPEAYIEANIVGFLNILECSRHYQIKHLVYASSSSVYGLNKKIPFSTSDNVDHPISLYAASKKSNELMAHTYSHLFQLPTTGLRFFTVYGPWGRPDMALYLFTKAIEKNSPINVFNYGKMERDFTFIADITEGVIRILEDGPRITKDGTFYKVYNIGNNNSVALLDFIKEIEKNLGKVATKNLLPMQDGDVAKTWADVNNLMEDYNYKPNTPISEGIFKFINWYKLYHKNDSIDNIP